MINLLCGSGGGEIEKTGGFGLRRGGGVASVAIKSSMQKISRLLLDWSYC